MLSRWTGKVILMVNMMMLTMNVVSNDLNHDINL